MASTVRTLSILAALTAFGCKDDDDNEDTDTAVDTDTGGPVAPREVAAVQGSLGFGWDADTTMVISPEVPEAFGSSLYAQLLLLDETYATAQTQQDLFDAIICVLVDQGSTPTAAAGGEGVLLDVSTASLTWAASSSTGFPDCRTELTGDDLATITAMVDDGLTIRIENGPPSSQIQSALPDSLDDVLFAGPAEEPGDSGDSGDTSSPSARWMEVDGADLTNDDAFLGATPTLNDFQVGLGYELAYLLNDDNDALELKEGEPYQQTVSLLVSEDGIIQSGQNSIVFFLDWAAMGAAAQ